MSIHRFREEVINVKLADALIARGLEANAETIKRSGRPDVLISLEGVKVVLEGRTASQEAALMRDAEERVENGVADISIAVVYPKDLKVATGMADLARKIEATCYSGCIFYADSSGVAKMPFQGASLDELVQYINAAFRIRVQNDVVREKVAEISDTMEWVVECASKSNLFFSSDVLIRELKQVLGIDPGEGQDEVSEAD